jgi:immunity protein, SdpI family
MRWVRTADVACVLMLAAMFLWAAIGWNGAPDRFPVHWGLSGEVDRFGGRAEGMLGAPILGLVLYLVLLFLPRIDPGRANYENFRAAYATVRVALVAMIAGVYGVMQHAARSGAPGGVASAVPFILGGLFLVLGNILGKVRPNWFVGIRTPWTLSSAESWTRTHRAGGWFFVAMGLVMLAAGAVARREAFSAAIALLVVGILGLCVYSYVVWRADPDKVPPAGRTAA